MQPQEAPQLASAPGAVPAPLFPIPPYRERQFAKGVGERLRNGAQAGENEQVILDAVHAERMALAQALGEPAVRAAFAAAYQASHHALAPQAPLSAEAARVATDQILDHRINDARQLALLVTQPPFIHAARAQALQAAPNSAEYQLPPEKITEMIAQFSAMDDAIVHAQQAMEGQRIGHLALAESFTPDGPLVDVLQQALSAHLDAATAQRVAVDWLQARRTPALATAQTLAEGGEVYGKVIQQVSNAHRTAQIQRKPLADQVPLAPLTGALMTTPLIQRSTSLTPILPEDHKTAQQKAEDVMYTLNHAITCLSITDLLVMPTVNGVLGTIFGKNAVKFGCAGHEHGHGDHGHEEVHTHGPHCDHGHHTHDHSPWDELKAPFRNMKRFFTSDEPWKTKFSAIFSNSKDWLISEAAGDVGAVLPTIAMQRFAPGTMHRIGNGLEHVFGASFQRGAQKAALSWGLKNGYESDSQQVADRAQELYTYEVRHLPQMAVWTLSSIAISWVVMHKLNPKMTVGDFARTKIVGAGVTAGLVVGARAVSPNKAHSWDGTMGKYVVAPTTKLLGKPFGIKSKDVDDFNLKRAGEDAPQWQGRLAEKSPELAPSV